MLPKFKLDSKMLETLHKWPEFFHCSFTGFLGEIEMLQNMTKYVFLKHCVLTSPHS